jgi:voltage-gated potassium channel
VQLRRLFYGHRPAAVAFQAGLLAVDLAAIAYFLATTFVADAPWLRVVDLLLGVLLALEFLGRMLAHRHPMQYLDNGAAIIDLVVIASLFVSALGSNLGFLRVLRTVRLFRSYNVLGRLKRLSPMVRRNEEVILAALNLTVFVIMVSSLVFVTQHGVNPKIEDFVDALYFSVSALSTTGFGDVTLIGSTGGELLSIAMMIVGITLFFRLAQAVFRPGGKVLYPCPQCGLQRHDPDPSTAGRAAMC